VPVAAALVLLAAAILLPRPSAALAHSMLSGADPAPDASLARPPERIVLTFTEPPVPALATVEIVDEDGERVKGVGDPEEVAGDDRRLRFALSRTLPNGVYTVNWRAVSSVDGHAAAGSYAFGVGVVPPTSAAGAAVSANSAGLTAAAAVGRWMLYSGLALMAGAASTTWLVLGGAIPTRARIVLWPAALLAVGGVFVTLLAQRAIAGVPSLLPLFQTNIGKLLGAQGVAALLCAVAVAAFLFWPRRGTLAVVGVVAAATMFFHVLLGHAGAPAPLRPLHLAEQWVHMTAIGVWLGGLVWLVLALLGMQKNERGATVWRFSRIATAALAVVVATGILRSLTELGPLSDLFTTRYGIALAIKIGLVAVLVTLGAVNHFRLVPAMRRTGDAPAFRWTTRGEIALAVVILAVTALLSGLVPASVANVTPQALPAGQAVARGTDYSLTMRVRLTATPGAAGRNVFSVRLSDYADGRPVAARKVQLVFSLPARPEIARSTLELSEKAPGRWSGGGMQLSIAGRWHVEVVVQQAAGGVSVPLDLRVRGSAD
jgi:copper transport protein